MRGGGATSASSSSGGDDESRPGGGDRGDVENNGASVVDSTNSTTTMPLFSQVYWNYRYEKHGQALHRVLNGLDCIIDALGNFANAMIFRHLLLNVIPGFVAPTHVICHAGIEQRVQGVHVVAVK
eukprot:11078957-Heterocapsa_arctica.AAC.1